MTTVNVLAVLKNNLPAFRNELLAEREKLAQRIIVIDRQVRLADELTKVLDDPLHDAGQRAVLAAHGQGYEV